MKRLSFIIQFNIEFLLQFTSCRKVLRKCLDQDDVRVRLVDRVKIDVFRVGVVVKIEDMIIESRQR